MKKVVGLVEVKEERWKMGGNFFIANNKEVTENKEK